VAGWRGAGRGGVRWDKAGRGGAGRGHERKSAPLRRPPPQPLPQPPPQNAGDQHSSATYAGPLAAGPLYESTNADRATSGSARIAGNNRYDRCDVTHTVRCGFMPLPSPYSTS